ncbi:MAG: GGDEF domain-containing protein [Burkholderiaceae bacterium]|nr:GGDEF domain-containing protein [Burkholderiaceae bacterium]
MRPLWSSRLRTLVFTSDRQQRIRLAQSALAIMLTLACVGIIVLLDMFGIALHRWVAPWVGITTCGMAAMFALIRSGRIKHWRDPSLTLPQMYYAISFAALGYVIAGSSRGVVVPMLAVILMFGTFGMSPKQVLRVGLYTLSAFGAASLYWMQQAPSLQAVAAEVVSLVMVLIVISGAVVLTGRLYRLRERARRQHQELKRAMSRIQELATHDELTGCLNRRAMQERMLEEADRSRRGAGTLCVVLMDLDHFKNVNDVYGHAAGDAVLQGFADVARAEIRTTDLMARWGGEEFLFLLGAVDAQQGQACVQRLVDRLARTRFPVLPDGVFVTCSAGFVVGTGVDDLRHLIDRADKAMYRAKSGGRNRLEAEPAALAA